jgi:hypothetical protein
LVAALGADPAIISQSVSVDPTKQYIFKMAQETVTTATAHAYLGQAVTDIVGAGNMALTLAAAGSTCRIGHPDQFGDSQKVTVHAAELTATDVVLSTISLREVLSTWYPNGRKVNSIEFHPGANGDICIFRDGWTTYVAQGDSYDPRCFHRYEAADLVATLAPKNFYGQRLKLFYDHENSTVSDGAMIIINWAE